MFIKYYKLCVKYNSFGNVLYLCYFIISLHFISEVKLINFLEFNNI